jgi:hypothetical protein
MRTPTTFDETSLPWTKLLVRFTEFTLTRSTFIKHWDISSHRCTLSLASLAAVVSLAWWNADFWTAKLQSIPNGLQLKNPTEISLVRHDVTGRDLFHECSHENFGYFLEFFPACGVSVGVVQAG